MIPVIKLSTGGNIEKHFTFYYHFTKEFDSINKIDHLKKTTGLFNIKRKSPFSRWAHINDSNAIFER